jgi:hypothetical protein
MGSGRTTATTVLKCDTIVSIFARRLIDGSECITL